MHFNHIPVVKWNIKEKEYQLQCLSPGDYLELISFISFQFWLQFSLDIEQELLEGDRQSHTE